MKRTAGAADSAKVKPHPAGNARISVAKGLWQKARKGELKEFTGVSAPYEEPERPEIVVETDKYDLEKCTQQIMSYLENKGIIPSASTR
jgi:adenylylsulfate kinase-like enzyme